MADAAHVRQGFCSWCGAVVVLGLAMLCVAARGVPLVEGIFCGIKAAVLVISPCGPRWAWCRWSGSWRSPAWRCASSV
jgi:hypothetical protein